MYVGQCEIAQTELDTFLATAKALQVKGLDDLEASVEVKQKATLAPTEIICQQKNKKALDGYLECKPCGIEFSKQWDLQEHSDKHHKEHNNMQTKYSILPGEYYNKKDNSKNIKKQNVAVSPEMSQKMLDLKNLGNNYIRCFTAFVVLQLQI